LLHENDNLQNRIQKISSTTSNARDARDERNTLEPKLDTNKYIIKIEEQAAQIKQLKLLIENLKAEVKLGQSNYEMAKSEFE